MSKNILRDKKRKENTLFKKMLCLQSRLYEAKHGIKKTGEYMGKCLCTKCNEFGYLYKTYQINDFTGVIHKPYFHVRHNKQIDKVMKTRRCYFIDESEIDNLLNKNYKELSK